MLIVAAVDVGITVGDGFAVTVGCIVGVDVESSICRLQAVSRINDANMMRVKQEY
jgi:hypothetical protein